MLRYCLVLTVFLGLIIAEPLSRTFENRDGPTLDDLELSFSLADEDASPRELQRSPRFITLSGINFIGTLIQHKISAISIAVTAIRWIASNVHALIFGGLISFAFCKITGKCQLSYDQVMPYGDSADPNYVMAEEFFDRAVRRYKRENGEF